MSIFGIGTGDHHTKSTSSTFSSVSAVADARITAYIASGKGKKPDAVTGNQKPQESNNQATSKSSFSTKTFG